MIANQVVNTLRQIIRKEGFVPLHEPSFQRNEWNYVKECIDTGWVSSAGKYVDEFERRLAEFVGVKRAVAVVNGTAALHIALQIAGVERMDEVLIPTLTFVATANAVSYCGAIPHFVDSSMDTLGVDPYKLADYLEEIAEVKEGKCINKQTGRTIRAIVPMHTFGHPVDMDPLLELCERYQIVVVEDAAESLGSYYKGRHTGQFGKVAAMSFNGNKIITTGGGGAILTNDEKLADYAKHITTTAKIPHKWEYIHDEVGYNYRMPNINAALGCAQLEELPNFLQQKRRLAELYAKAFDLIENVSFFYEQSFAQSNYWLNAIILDQTIETERDAVLQALNDNGLMSRPIWKPMHMLSMYNSCPRMDLSVAEKLEKRVINIPSSPNLSDRYED
jgi:perosamine synthetase